MSRSRKQTGLNVYLNSRYVGQLTRHSTGAVEFRYALDWLAWEHTMPISYSLPLREDRYIGAPVVAVFDNLLPDTESVRRHIARTRTANGTDAFSLLEAIGRDCVGALQFLPEGEAPNPTDQIQGDTLNRRQVTDILSNLFDTPLGLGDNQNFRISIAGAQEKTALLFRDEQWIQPHGTTPTTHILKPGIGRLPNGIDLSTSVENEHLCLRLLSAFGLNVARTQIERFGDRQVLVIERFDRHQTGDGRLLRIPQEDCCQALGVPSTKKYQSDGGPGMGQILELLLASDDSIGDRLNFLKAQILFWLMAATDGHAKNFSIFLMPGPRIRTTPLYDVISVQPNIDAGEIPKQKAKLAMSVGTNRHYVVETVRTRHFSQIAIQAKLEKGTTDSILEDIAQSFDAAWRNATADLPESFPAALVDSIKGGMMNRLKIAGVI